MVWNSLGDFFYMGGYALYVWGSVIVTFGFMVTELIILKLRRQAILDHLGRAHELDEDSLFHPDEKKGSQ